MAQPQSPTIIPSVVQPSSPTTIWPGEFLEINLPPDLPADSDYIVELRLDSPSIRKCSTSEMWPLPSVLASVAGRISIPNLSAQPHTLKRHEHFCQVDPLSTPCCDSPVPALAPPVPFMMCGLPDTPLSPSTLILCG